MKRTVRPGRVERGIGFGGVEVGGREMEGMGWLVRWAQAPSSVGVGRLGGYVVSIGVLA
jgi:hypothetical protein